ncbi:MAG: 3-phosphoshikimate 1-carboxyvinyltransferase [Zetaproteobacteria bacterium]|nr:3-phosphoshikimate 1-carboxyvinyltransferase [Zetaproteobacteria bacterium]
MNIGGTLIAGAADQPLKGAFTPPGDKSMSHRAVMLASLANGITEIEGFLPGEDNIATAKMFEAMGVTIEWLSDDQTKLRIHGVGLYGLQEPSQVLDAGNSGTCARLMTGVLAGQNFHTVLVGDASLHKRPMRRVAEPVRRMGAHVDGAKEGELLPLAIRGGNLKAMAFQSEVASAQVKSCVMFAALYAEGDTTVREPKPTRDHTERMFPLFGQPVSIDNSGLITVQPSGTLTAPAGVLHIPADPSSATFFAVATAIIPGSEVLLQQVGLNPRRDGWRRILTAMGGDISLLQEKKIGDEPVSDIFIRGGGVHGINVDPNDVPDAIDEFPVLFVAAALAEGSFILSQAEELRVKESDRITTMVKALQACGASIEEKPDGVIIQGQKRLKGGVTVDAHGDHRIAMAMAVAAQCADAPITIINAAAIATSFPSFVATAQQLGMNVAWKDEA